MDDMSYYSDEESVCLGLTFTHNSNKLAQSSTNSTDSGVECTDRTVLELSNMCESETAKCETDSGCDVKQPDTYPSQPDTYPSQSIENIYPGITESKLLVARVAALGGVKGGNVASLTTRSLDILNGKFDDASQKCALRPNPLAADIRKDKRPCNKTPWAMSRDQNRDQNRDQSNGTIYENIGNCTPTRKPVYVNHRPIKFMTPQKTGCKKSMTPQKTGCKKSMASTAPNQDPSVLYNTPVKRNYLSRATPHQAPPHCAESARRDASRHAPQHDATRTSPPHHYELIISPASSTSLHTNRSSASPRAAPHPHDPASSLTTISSKSASPGFLSPGEIARAWDADSSSDIRSYHEAVRSHRIETPPGVRHRDVSPDSHSHHENPLYSDPGTLNTAQRYDTFTTRGSPHREMGRNSPHREMGRNSPHREMGRNSPHREMGRNSPHREMGRSSPHREMGRSSPHRNAGRNSPRHNAGRSSPRRDVRNHDSNDNIYDRFVQSHYDRYNSDMYHKKRCSVDSSPGYTGSSGSTSDIEYNRHPHYTDRVDHGRLPPARQTPRHTDRARSPHSRGSEIERAKSRFRYSISNIRPVQPSSDEDGDEGDGKRGVVLIQATLEDIHSLYQVQDDIFELRFADSGLTSDLIHLLGDLCNEKNIVRLIFEDCELEDWSLLSKVVDQTKISHLGFHSCNVGDEGCVRISQLLSTTPTIASLDLVQCRVACAGVAALGVALMQNTTLKSLNLSKNTFQTKGAVLFFRALKGGNSTLQFLSLSSSCCGGTEVVMMIVALLLRNTALSHLNLNNTGLTDDGVTLIAESLAHNTNLTSLCISGNGLQDGSAHEIAVTLADRNSLQHVDLSNNELSNRGMHVLIQSSTVHNVIRRLDLTNNSISPRQYMQLLTLVEDLALVGVIVF